MVINFLFYLPAFPIFKWHVGLFLIYMCHSLNKCVFYGFHMELIKLLLQNIKCRLKSAVHKQKSIPVESMETLICEIEQCRYEYGKINKLVNCTNKMFGMSILVITIQIIFSITSIMYWFIESFLLDEEHTERNPEMVLMLIVFGFVLSFVCNNAQKCINTTDDVTLLLFKMKRNESNKEFVSCF